MSNTFKFEGTIMFPEDCEIPDEDYLDMTAFYYGDKHQDFVLNVVPGTIEEVTK